MKHILCLLFVLIISNSIFSQSCDLPSEFPTDPIELEEANRLIAECFAPTIHQMTERGPELSASGKADLITSAFYTGNISTKDNWEALENFESGNPINFDELDLAKPDKVHQSHFHNLLQRCSSI